MVGKLLRGTIAGEIPLAKNAADTRTCRRRVYANGIDVVWVTTWIQVENLRAHDVVPACSAFWYSVFVSEAIAQVIAVVGICKCQR